MAVRALAFDVFGTLVDWRSSIVEAFRASGVAGDPGELADGWRERYVPIMLEVNARLPMGSGASFRSLRLPFWWAYEAAHTSAQRLPALSGCY